LRAAVLALVLALAGRKAFRGPITMLLLRRIFSSHFTALYLRHHCALVSGLTSTPQPLNSRKLLQVHPNTQDNKYYNTYYKIKMMQFSAIYTRNEQNSLKYNIQKLRIILQVNC
jgi:hypothetical protein